MSLKRVVSQIWKLLLEDSIIYISKGGGDHETRCYKRRLKKLLEREWNKIQIYYSKNLVFQQV